MNKKIKILEQKKLRAKNFESKIQDQIQKEINKIFDKDKEIKKALIELESSQELTFDEFGEVSTWLRFELPEKYKAYIDEFLNYIGELGAYYDLKNDCLLSHIGDDYISIQDDTRSDNGVWQNHKIIIEESEYKDDDGNIDELKRNELIEEYMEKNGFFPYVIRVNRYGNAFFVSTNNKKDGTI
jgi:hypothetical protein